MTLNSQIFINMGDKSAKIGFFTLKNHKYHKWVTCNTSNDLYELDNQLCWHFMEFRGSSLCISVIILTIVNLNSFWSLRYLVKMVKISIRHNKKSWRAGKKWMAFLKSAPKNYLKSPQLETSREQKFFFVDQCYS